MVEGTTTAATTTTTERLDMITSTNTSTTQKTIRALCGLGKEGHSSTFASMDSSDDEVNYPSPALEFLSYSDDSETDIVIPSSESVKIRLPSGKTISRKANGPHASKHRHRRIPSPNTTSHVQMPRKVHGNCAMITSPAIVQTSTPNQKPRHPTTPPTSDSESEYDHPSVLSRHQFTPGSLAPHICLVTHRTTIRNSDAQMLATLPASTQRTLLATSRKAVGRAGREEQEYRSKLDGYGNLKSKERFVNDVPGGKSHKNRFMAQ
ncbi:hypothetical protein PMIN07_009206 [Paraphaeosphaeria minitans]